MQRLVFLAAYRFPGGDAMSNRILQLARAACPPGVPALIVNDWPSDGGAPAADPPLPDGVELLTLRGVGRNRGARLLLRLGRPVRVVAALRRAGVRRHDIAAVCLPVGLMSLATWAVFGLWLGRPIVADALERHDRTQFRGRALAPAFIRHRWSTFLSARLADRVIAVSTVLGDHMTSRGVLALVVPPLVDCDAFPASRPPAIEKGVRLVYAGSPFTKDMLDVVIEGIRLLADADQARLTLTIAGVERSHATEHSDLRAAGLEALGGRVTFLGHVSRTRVLELLSTSHFSVLVRPTGGYADAGFPSKVPESLAAGCPVLLNHTSDLGRYVEDGREGIVLKGYTAEDVRRGLEAAFEIDHTQWTRMSEAARARALSFDYRSWAPDVTAFLVQTSDSSRERLPAVRRGSSA